jgi:hypothetical protein
VEQPGVGERLEQRPGQLALGVDLVRARADLGNQLVDSLEQRRAILDYDVRLAPFLSWAEARPRRLTGRGEA